LVPGAVIALAEARMRIHDNDNFIEINFREAMPHDLPGADDVLLHVALASSGFSGETDVWIEASELETFLQRAEDFEIRRQGEIEFGSMTPGLFRFQIFSIDRKGHLAVSGRLSTTRRGSEGGLHSSAAEFAFDFDPGQLASFVRDLRKMLRSDNV
jgi:hypothetical protein